MSNVTLKQLQDELTSVLNEALNSPKLKEFLEKHGIEDEALQINSSIDVNRMKNMQVLDVKLQANDDSEATLGDKIQLRCCSCGGSVCCPCG